MKVYLAAPYKARDYMLIHVARHLEFKGHVVVSSWIREDHLVHSGTINAAPSQTEEYCASHIARDFADIDSADVVVLFTGQFISESLYSVNLLDTVSGGRHVEVGYALAKGKRVIVVGNPENIFHRGGRVEIVPNFPTVVEALGPYPPTKKKGKVNSVPVKD